MSVKVVTQPFATTGTTTTFVVPQGEVWTLRSVVAHVTRGAGGVPNRAYTLTITNGTDTVSAFAAADAGTDPGTCEVTWADCPGGVGASGNAGVASAPLKAQNMPPGYTITATITGTVAGDNIDAMTVWLDYVDAVAG